MNGKPKKATLAGKVVPPFDTREFDREFIMDQFRPLTPEERAEWEQAKRKRGRPRIGRGAKVISVSVEKALLHRSDLAAKRLGISRAALIARGLEAALTCVGEPKE